MSREFYTPWPINKTDQPSLSGDETSRAEQVAKKYLDADPLLSSEWFRRRGVTSGWTSGPSLYFEDHRSIDLTTERGAKSFEYRSLGLASDGDYYLVSSPRNRNYENYLRDTIGLGAPTVLEIPHSYSTPPQRLAVACCGSELLLNSLASAAKENKGLNITPFISSGDAWRLGAEIAHRSHCQLRISGPLPQLTAYANNKLWFAELVRTLIGKDALPLTYEVYGLANAAFGLKQLSRISSKFVIKVPASAGALGNIVFDRSDFSKQNLINIRNILSNDLATIGWRGEFPLLLSVWDETVSASPSVQMWLPHSTQGPPSIEGLFVQSISDIRGGFMGAEPAKLPGFIEQQITREALLIGMTLQRMGYFGRLSLDAVVLEGATDNFSIHWIEANARWGGVSIPMTVAQRINRHAMNDGLLIVQKIQYESPTEDLLKAISESDIPQVSLQKGEQQGVVFLAPLENEHLIFAVVGFAEKTAATIAQRMIDLGASPV